MRGFFQKIPFLGSVFIERRSESVGFGLYREEGFTSLCLGRFIIQYDLPAKEGFVLLNEDSGGEYEIDVCDVDEDALIDLSSLPFRGNEGFNSLVA